MRPKPKLILPDLHQCSPWIQRGALFPGHLKAALRDLQRCRFQRAGIIAWLDKPLGSGSQIEPWRVKSTTLMKTSFATHTFSELNR